MPTLQPFCKSCNSICDIWLGSDGVLRYICPAYCDEDKWPVPTETLYGQKVLPTEKVYVSKCWNCSGFVDSRLPQLCPRDVSDGKNNLFKCPDCGKSMKEFK